MYSESCKIILIIYDLKMSKEKLMLLQNLPLEQKIFRSKIVLEEFLRHVDNRAFVSFSGGKDSTVLLHLCRQIDPTIVGVFCDTGLEYPEIKDFVKCQQNIVTIRPKMGFKQVLEKYGWPIVSKEQSHYIGQCQRTKSKKLYDYRMHGKGLNGKTGKISNKWQYLVSSPLKISATCCDIMKKNPFKKYVKETGLKPIIGTMASESRLRERQWLKNGCNSFQDGKESCKPLSFWKEKDIYEYLELYDLKISEIYAKGAKRTGCVFCLYGYHMEKQGETRLDLLKNTHPNLYEYCMKKLGMEEVLKWYPKN